MATGYYLLDNQPKTPQYNKTRRNRAKVTGTITVHTFESAPDWVGPDTGVENAVNYLRTRLDPGSYHSAVDSDSTIRVIPWQYEAFHDRFTNNWSIGVSIATQADKWGQAPKDWRDKALRRAAAESARIADEIYTELGIDVPAVWLTQKEAHARKPGFVRHGTSDPGRRSDPWPVNAPEADEFLTHYKAARTTGRYATTTTTTTDPSEEDDMKILATYQGKTYVGDGITRRHIENPTVLADLKWHYDQAGIRYRDVGKVDRIEFLGKELLDKADGDTLRRTAQAAADNTAPITRGGKKVSLRQEVADIKTMLLDQNKEA